MDISHTELQTTWLSTIMWTLLGLVGAGISVGIRVGRKEKLNPWVVGTTLIAGMAAAGTSTQALVDFAHLSAGWSGAVALLLGLMAMGLAMNAFDNKIPFVNKLLGKPDDQ